MQEHIPGGEDKGIFAKMDDAIAAASAAQKQLATLKFNSPGLNYRSDAVEARADVELFARMPLEETGKGRYEDKLQKNL